MACLAHDDWPSDEEEFLTALKERVHPLGGPESALAAPARLTCPCEECGTAAVRGAPPPRCSFFRCDSCHTWSAKTAKHSSAETLRVACRRCHRETLHERCGTRPPKSATHAAEFQENKASGLLPAPRATPADEAQDEEDEPLSMI